jgi:ubiquinone/menaquinone biosynthesis C-methylase UbiE
MEDSREYFARVAGDWDRMRAGYFTEEMRDAAIARAGLAAGCVVADVGTGTGFVLRALAPIASTAYGFDASPDMLVVARGNLAGFGNVVLLQATGEALPLPDAAVDAAFANMYLHHTLDPGAAVTEMARILRPGGCLVLTDLDAHNQAWMRDAMADRWLGFPREQVRAWFEGCGLASVEVSCAQGSCCTAAPDGSGLSLGVFLACGRKP